MKKPQQDVKQGRQLQLVNIPHQGGAIAAHVRRPGVLDRGIRWGTRTLAPAALAGIFAAASVSAGLSSGWRKRGRRPGN